MHLMFDVNVLYLLVMLTIAFGVALVVMLGDFLRNRRIDLLNPGLVFLALYLLYNCLVFVNPESRELPGATGFALAALVGLAGILAGTALAYSPICSKRALREPIMVPRQTLLFFSILLVIVSAGMIILMFVRNAGISVLLRGDSFERNNALGGVLSGFSFLLPLGAGFSIALLLSSRARLRAAYLAVIFMALGILFYLASSRGDILYSCLLAIFVYHYNAKRIRMRTILIAACALLVLMVVLDLVRVRINESPERIMGLLTVESISSLLQPERLEPYKCGVRHIELVHDGPPDGNYLLGSSFFYFIPYLAPRFLNLFERPTMLEAWYVTTYDPYIAARGGGWGFSPLIDAYFNFAEVGCFLYFFFFSLVLNRLHVSAMQTPPNSLLRLFSCVFGTTLLPVFRTSISTYLKNYVCVFAFAGFLLLIFCVYWKRGFMSPFPQSQTVSLQPKIKERTS